MASVQQIEANRRNGQRSQGPKSNEGRASSSKNSLKHGLTAKGVLLPNEDAAALAELGDALGAELNPQGAVESFLVDRIIALSWRLQRLGKIEAGILGWQHLSALSRHAKAQAYEQTFGSLNEETIAEPRRLELQKHLDSANGGAAFVYDSGNENAIGKLSRYETSMERSLYKALHELQRLQAGRQGKEVPLPVAIDIDVSGIKQR